LESVSVTTNGVPVGSDLSHACELHEAIFVLQRKIDDTSFEFLQNKLKTIPIWHNLMYWNEYFWVLVYKEYKQFQMYEDDDNIFNQKLFPLLLSRVLYEMIFLWEVNIDGVTQLLLDIIKASVNNYKTSPCLADLEIFRESPKESKKRIINIENELDKLYYNAYRFHYTSAKDRSGKINMEPANTNLENKLKKK